MRIPGTRKRKQGRQTRIRMLGGFPFFFLPCSFLGSQTLIFFLQGTFMFIITYYRSIVAYAAQYCRANTYAYGKHNK